MAALSSLPSPTLASPNNRWFREEASTSTRENAIYSLKMIEKKGWVIFNLFKSPFAQLKNNNINHSCSWGRDSTVLLVTNLFHQRRSLWVFKRAARDLGMSGMRFRVARVPFVGHKGYGLTAIDRAVDIWDFGRELLAIPYYLFRGYI